jgi:DNA repair protein REV1
MNSEGVLSDPSFHFSFQIDLQIIRYKQFSLLFYTILMGHADDLQAVSVDEALIDVTTTVVRLKAEAIAQGRVQADCAKEFAETIRAQVKKSTGCEGLWLRLYRLTFQVY